MPYLLKTEPDQVFLRRPAEGRRDDLGRHLEPPGTKNLRSMKPGEKLVIYHSNEGKAAVGTAKAVSVNATDPKNPLVRIQAVKRLKREKTLAEMRDAPVFEGSILFRQFRLSVVPLTPEQYDWLIAGDRNS